MEPQTNLSSHVLGRTAPCSMTEGELIKSALPASSAQLEGHQRRAAAHSQSVQAEHSLELHLPFLAHITRYEHSFSLY